MAKSKRGLEAVEAALAIPFYEYGENEAACVMAHALVEAAARIRGLEAEREVLVTLMAQSIVKRKEEK